MRARGEFLREQMHAEPVAQSPPPWRMIVAAPVNGLFEIGFGEGEHADLLLVVSSNGRDLFDCRSGEVVARDHETEHSEWYDPIRLRAAGIGPLHGQTIRLAGLHGGGLPRMTDDRWMLSMLYFHWPEAAALLQGPDSISIRIANLEDPRACGFSETGKTLVLAEPHGLQVFSP